MLFSSDFNYERSNVSEMTHKKKITRPKYKRCTGIADNEDEWLLDVFWICIDNPLERLPDHADVQSFYFQLTGPGRCGRNLKQVLFKLISMMYVLIIWYETAFREKTHNVTKISQHWLRLEPGLPTSKISFPYFVEKISVFWVTFPYPLICSSPDLKPFILATSYLLWWDPSTPSGNSSGFFQYYRNRKLARKQLLLLHVEERRLIVLVIKEVFGGFKA